MKTLMSLFAALLLLSGCAVSTPKFDVGSTFSAKQLPPLKDGLARVIFVRPRATVPLLYEIYDHEIIAAGALGRGFDSNNVGRCHIYDAVPGEHLFSLSYLSGLGVTGDIAHRGYTFLEAQLRAGLEYYVLFKANDTAFSGWRADLVPLSQKSEHFNQLGNWLAECKIGTIGEDARQWAVKYSKELGEMRREYFQKLEGKSKFGKLIDSDGFPLGTVFPISHKPEEHKN